MADPNEGDFMTARTLLAHKPLLLLVAMMFCTPAQQLTDTIVWKKSGEGFDSYYQQGTFFEVTRYNGLEVRTALSDTGWRMKATVAILNRGTVRVDVLPQTFRLDVVVPKAKSLKYESPDTLARSINRDAGWRSVGPAMRTNATKTVTSTSHESGTVSAGGQTGSYSGVAETTTVVADEDARRRAKQELAEIAERAQQDVARINELTLMSNSLESGQEVSGAAFFQRDKKAREVILTIPLNGIRFQFPFRFQR